MRKRNASVAAVVGIVVVVGFATPGISGQLDPKIYQSIVPPTLPNPFFEIEQLLALKAQRELLEAMAAREPERLQEEQRAAATRAVTPAAPVNDVST